MRFEKYIYRIQRFSIHDGPGIRTTLFFQGCPLACIWCHNPESQAAVKPVSDEGVNDLCRALMDEICKDMMFYDQSGGGVTFSGGEPLMQPHLLGSLARQCRHEGIHTCLDTSGYVPVQLMSQLYMDFDLILYDLKLFDSPAHVKYTGRPLEYIRENLVFLSKKEACVRLRFPMIPGITDTPDNIEKIRRFVSANTVFRDIHILPLHKTAQTKYVNLKVENKIRHVEIPDRDAIDKVSRAFKSEGFNVFIGG